LEKVVFDTEDDLFSEKTVFRYLTIDPKQDLPKFDDIVDKLLIFD
jgi:hypothetical protein